MALYTPPSLPPTPPSYPMDAPLPPLPVELLHTWSSWRPPKPEPPPTPPLSNPPLRRVLPPQSQSRTVLPPITHFDHALTRVSPITPPQTDDSTDWRTHGSTSFRWNPPSHAESHCSPPITHEDSATAAHSLPSPPFHLDWFTGSEHRSSQFLAEKTCEMICYLWFSSLSQSSSPSKRNRIASQEQPPYIPPSNSATASLQFSVSPAFVRFMQKVLETTQVSQSVIVLSLHYIYRMKARNRFASGQSGSEYRVAIAALMMANKFLDDNTYTNKTWSEVSGIELAEVNRMEKEFLLGIDFGLYVGKSTYDSWLNLLQGLVMAKERELHQWRRSWRPARSLPRGHSSKHTSPHSIRSRPSAYRARSSSPRRSSSGGSLAYSAQPDLGVRSIYGESSTALPPGSKRTATDAFYPDMAPTSYGEPPRRSVGLTLQIPELQYASGHSSESSASPMESLQSFAKLSLGASPVDDPNAPPWVSVLGHNEVPNTLASAYRVDEQHPYAVPQNLYFYTLTSSPSDDNNARRGRLRYHQPPQPSNSSARVVGQMMPMVIQSASASPYDMPVRLPHATVLPPFSELSREWRHANHQVDSHGECQQLAPESIPSAPFANAGPPGFQFHATAVPACTSNFNRTRFRH